MNSDTELLFPMRVIPLLRELRGGAWRDLVDHVMDPETPIEEQLGFVLMMVDLCSCSTCNSYSYRAMRGCTVCASSTIQRFRDDDKALISKHKKSSKAILKAYKDVHFPSLTDPDER
jgi:hypothetical protein